MKELEQIFSAVLLGTGLTVILMLYGPKNPRLTKGHSVIVAALSLALMSLVQLTNSWQEEGYYLHIFVLLLSGAALLRMWTGWNWPASIQRIIPWYLICECMLLVLSYMSFKLSGMDVFRTLPLWRMLIMVTGLTLVSLTLLLLLRQLLPGKVYADGKTLSICLLSMLPYLFMRQIHMWLQLPVENITTPVVVALVCSALLSLILCVQVEKLMYAEADKRRAMAGEMEARRERQHYETLKNSMDRVRQEYHDMKNLLLYLEKAPNLEHVHDRLGEILSSISPFEHELDTGNEVVDIVMGDKLALCEKWGIRCTVMVDGKSLEAVHPLDLATILGNAMDNAVEACQKVKETEKRAIQVRTASMDGFVVLHVHNTCDPALRVHGDLPATSKSDKEWHGFGLGNMRKTMSKYGGEMVCEAQDGEFELTLLFPRSAD